MRESFGVVYSNAVGKVTGRILLEQDEWVRMFGKVTAIDAIRRIAEIMYSSNSPDIDCSVFGEDGLAMIVYAYPFDLSMAYKLRISRGELSKAEIEMIEKEQFLTFEGTNVEELAYPCAELVEYEWLGRVFSATSLANGNNRVISPPTPKFDQIYCTTNKKIFASLRVKYRTERHKYLATVPAREEDPENVFSAVVYAIFEGGIEWLELEPAPNADERKSMEVPCGYRTIVTVTGPDDQPYHPEGEFNRYLKYDYCSFVLKSDIRT